MNKGDCQLKKIYKQLQNQDNKTALEIFKQEIQPLDIAEFLLILDNNDQNRLYYTRCFEAVMLIYKAELFNHIRNTTAIPNFEHGEYTWLLFKKVVQFLMTLYKFNCDSKELEDHFVDVYSNFCIGYEQSPKKCLAIYQEIYTYYPENCIFNYNMGLLYQKLNDTVNAIIHFTLVIKFIEQETKEVIRELPRDLKKLLINSYHGLASVFRSNGMQTEALVKLENVKKRFPLNPDINNQLGILYSELRRSDLAENCYRIAIDNYTKTVVHSNAEYLLSEIYLNYGQMTTEIGDTKQSIKLYNQSLELNHTFVLPFQNKIMNLNYLYSDIAQKDFIFKQHKLINQLYCIQGVFTFKEFGMKKVIGFVSGDFIGHPVSYFVSSILQSVSFTKEFDVICYSTVNVNKYQFEREYPTVQLKLLSGLSDQEAADLIYADTCSVLIDLSGHTAQNRMGVFALKPAPVQISWIGYPYTTGLNTMDYKLTDNIVDNKSISQKMYTEKLLFMDPFLCYNIPKNLPDIVSQERLPLRIGCFNRLNKISDTCLKMYKELIDRFGEQITFVFKTKALMNKCTRARFINKFTAIQQKSIEILDCTVSHTQHLQTYNKVDISLDTFCYSGTTSTCESLSMGVPVITLYDTTDYFSPQNVSASILKNSGLEEFVCESKEQIQNLIVKLIEKKPSKSFVSDCFTNGKICDKGLHSMQFIKVIKDVTNTN